MDSIQTIIDRQPEVSERHLGSRMVTMTIDELHAFGKSIVNETIKALSPKTASRRYVADKYFDGSLYKLDSFLDQNPTVYRKDIGKTSKYLIFMDEFLAAFNSKKNRVKS